MTYRVALVIFGVGILCNLLGTLWAIRTRTLEHSSIIRQVSLTVAFAGLVCSFVTRLNEKAGIFPAAVGISAVGAAILCFAVSYYITKTTKHEEAAQVLITLGINSLLVGLVILIIDVGLSRLQ